MTDDIGKKKIQRCHKVFAGVFQILLIFINNPFIDEL